MKSVNICGVVLLYLRLFCLWGCTEPHPLIPISKYKNLEYSVDVMENIVSLCNHCHNLLHYGRFQGKKPILEKLYIDRREALHNCGLDLTLEQLESIINKGIDDILINNHR